MAGAVRGRSKSLQGEGEEEQGRAPHQQVNGANAEELGYSGAAR
jgi:hypothetical protein